MAREILSKRNFFDFESPILIDLDILGKSKVRFCRPRKKYKNSILTENTIQS
jgi:hypothetical protein